RDPSGNPARRLRATPAQPRGTPTSSAFSNHSLPAQRRDIGFAVSRFSQHLVRMLAGFGRAALYAEYELAQLERQRELRDAVRIRDHAAGTQLLVVTRLIDRKYRAHAAVGVGENPRPVALGARSKGRGDTLLDRRGVRTVDDVLFTELGAAEHLAQGHPEFPLESPDRHEASVLRTIHVVAR